MDPTRLLPIPLGKWKNTSTTTVTTTTTIRTPRAVSSVTTTTTKTHTTSSSYAVCPRCEHKTACIRQYNVVCIACISCKHPQRIRVGYPGCISCHNDLQQQPFERLASCSNCFYMKAFDCVYCLEVGCVFENPDREGSSCHKCGAIQESHIIDPSPADNDYLDSDFGDRESDRQRLKPKSSQQQQQPPQQFKQLASHARNNDEFRYTTEYADYLHRLEEEKKDPALVSKRLLDEQINQDWQTILRLAPFTTMEQHTDKALFESVVRLYYKRSQKQFRDKVARAVAFYHETRNTYPEQFLVTTQGLHYVEGSALRRAKRTIDRVLHPNLVLERKKKKNNKNTEKKPDSSEEEEEKEEEKEEKPEEKKSTVAPALTPAPSPRLPPVPSKPVPPPTTAVVDDQTKLHDLISSITRAVAAGKKAMGLPDVFNSRIDKQLALLRLDLERALNDPAAEREKKLLTRDVNTIAAAVLVCVATKIAVPGPAGGKPFTWTATAVAKKCNVSYSAVNQCKQNMTCITLKI